MNGTRTVSTIAALFAATALVAGTVAPAAAAPNDHPKTKQEDKDAKEAKEAKKRYCIQGPTTGTMLPKRICHTRAEWLAEGFDPLKKN